MRLPTPNTLWTPRWTPLLPPYQQLQLWRSTARYNIVTSGRRSGKTELAKRRIAEAAVTATAQNQSIRLLITAPTEPQAKAIYWQDLKDLIDPAWLLDINESDLQIMTLSGTTITLAGLEKPQRIEGVQWQAAISDEIADCPPDCWRKHVMIALDKQDSWAWIIGTPDSQARNTHEQKTLIALAENPNQSIWQHHTWSAEDILDPTVADIFRDTLDPHTFNQEIHGSLQPDTLTAFPDFDEKQHVRAISYNAAHPLYWSLDFNVNPMCTGILQHIDGTLNILHEIVTPHSDTREAVKNFLQLTHEKGYSLNDLTLFGDSTGYARDTTSGLSDWSIIKSTLQNHRPMYCIPNTNPPVKETINAVRALLRNANNESRLQIHPSCPRLIRDIKTAQWPSPLNDQHCLAWLRYAAAELQRPRPPKNFIRGVVAFSNNR